MSDPLVPQLHSPDVETWCVLHFESHHLDYDTFSCEADALRYAEDVRDHGIANGVPVQIHVTRVHWTTP